ncbi:MAG: DUF3710 domain-containing protein [Actinomycetota bacterium]|nr:DUF3710 domain-containing protein [Actinomycetota bacterium]
MPFGRKRRLDRSVRERGVAPEVEERHRDDDRESTTGPFDIGDVGEDDVERVDFGAMLIPKSPDNDLRVGLDAKGRVVSVSVHRNGSAMQIGAYAAPRDGAIWPDLRPELAQSISSQGGRARETGGPFGPELAAELAPPRTGGKEAAKAPARPARFLGVDGPRWFLRAVLTGPAATDEQAAEPLLTTLREVVVVRGSEPKPVREPLPLKLPAELAEQFGQAVDADADKPPPPPSITI